VPLVTNEFFAQPGRGDDVANLLRHRVFRWRHRGTPERPAV